MRKGLAILLLMFSFVLAKGQYELQFNQLIKAVEFINPGYNAIQNTVTGNIIYSNQWNGFPGSPTTAAASFHVPISNNHLGFGALFTNETLGHRELRTAGLSIDTDLRISSSVFVTMGIMAGYQIVDYNIENATTSYIEALNDIYNFNAPVVGTGFNVIVDKFHLGISGYYNIAPQEYETELMNELTIYANGSYWFRLDDIWRLKVSGLYKSRGNYASIAEGGVFFLFKDIFWLGTSYRYQNAAIVSADIKLSSYIRIGYSYALGLGQLANFTGSSHEIQLLLNLPQRKENRFATTNRND